MDLIQAILLAAIQGITEFLPISSSGHLVLPAVLLGWEDQGLAFDVAVHVGSLAAVVWYFRRDVAALLVGWLRQVTGGGTSAESRLAWAVILGTLPAGTAGLLLNGWIEANTRTLVVLASTTILYGILLGVADRFGRRALDEDSIDWKAALWVGFAQALALIPGTSRSGITMTAALLMGFKREVAARFSFLLSMPIIAAAGLLKSVELVESAAPIQWDLLLVGVAVSAVTAYLCIRLFLSWLERIGMMPFVWYRLALGGVLIAMIFAGGAGAL